VKEGELKELDCVAELQVNDMFPADAGVFQVMLRLAPEAAMLNGGLCAVSLLARSDAS
jgi:hypothetical protein